MTRPLHVALDRHARELTALSRALERAAAPHEDACDTVLLPLAELATSCLARAAPVFHNRRVIHARMAVQGHREVLRAYARSDLRALTARCGEPGPLFDVSPLLSA